MGSAYDIRAAFEAIEAELISSMMRNISHHTADVEAAGFAWTQWQQLQLQAMADYSMRNRAKFGKKFAGINRQAANSIAAAYKNGSLSQEAKILRAMQRGFKPPYKVTPGFFHVNAQKLEALQRATVNDLSRAERAVLRYTDDQYRKIIYNAQVYANTGSGSVYQAVDMATKDFLSKGIACITYSNGAQHNITNYAEMAIRTANKRAYLVAEGEKRKEFGLSLVEVSPNASPCPLCADWVGKILVDDVYSDGAPDGKHDLLSDAMGAGLFHPNCTDILSTHFPDIDEEGNEVDENGNRIQEVQPDKEQAEKDYQTEQDYRHAQNMGGRYSRLSEFSLDPSNKRRYGNIAAQWAQKANALEFFVDEKTPCLRRVSDGALVQTEISSIKPKAGEFKDWMFNWVKQAKSGSEIYALRIAGDKEIQGLMAIRPDKNMQAVFLDLVEASPKNNKMNPLNSGTKEYAGIGAHLTAEGVKKSYELGYNGVVVFDAKSGLIEHYKKELGAKQIGHTTRMYIDEAEAKKLYDTYYGKSKHK